MQIGVHGLVFTGEFDEKGLVTAASGARQAGFDLLELPLADRTAPTARSSAASSRTTAWR